MTTHIQGEYLSRRAVAQAFGVSLKNVDKVVELNRIRIRRVPGCRVYYRAADVHNVLAAADQSSLKHLNP